MPDWLHSLPDACLCYADSLIVQLIATVSQHLQHAQHAVWQQGPAIAAWLRRCLSTCAIRLSLARPIPTCVRTAGMRQGRYSAL